ncbi:hypothetical protein E4U21_005911 [Claviceps maximensis]|nr:hypothetical protein E4U21_005911 [Claviceps maximensis]
MSPSSPLATFKRKRCENVATDRSIAFSFDLSRPDTSHDGDRSPRSKMAHRFLGLALGSGGGRGAAINDDGDDNDNDDDDDDGSPGTMDATRKRQKSDQYMIDSGLTGSQSKKQQVAEIPELRPHVFVELKTQAEHAGCPSKPLLSPDETNTSIPNKSPLRKRAGTPPPQFRLPPEVPEKVDIGQDRQDPEAEGLREDDDVVDPIRAALTWREDEITVYDPEDADDDGFGVNGIGFKPTAALAHSRVIRRRQQMADYRKREECEARSKRTQRRRGGESLSARPKRKLPARRVHFLDPERQHTAVFTS